MRYQANRRRDPTPIHTERHKCAQMERSAITVVRDPRTEQKALVIYSPKTNHPKTAIVMAVTAQHGWSI